jgi:ribosomal protein S18 acetylase RimI-like enzyme
MAKAFRAVSQPRKPDIVIAEIGSHELDELAPIWEALRAHHIAVAADWFPEPYGAKQSWELRRVQYEAWLAEPGTFALIAREAERSIGYVFVRLRSGSPTWRFAERAGEIETLSVLPEARHRGVGQALLEAAYVRLRELGATEVSLHVLQGNELAERFYERDGFKCFGRWLVRPL